MLAQDDCPAICPLQNSRTSAVSPTAQSKLDNTLCTEAAAVGGAHCGLPFMSLIGCLAVRRYNILSLSVRQPTHSTLLLQPFMNVITHVCAAVVRPVDTQPLNQSPEADVQHICWCASRQGPPVTTQNQSTAYQAAPICRRYSAMNSFGSCKALTARQYTLPAPALPCCCSNSAHSTHSPASVLP